MINAQPCGSLGLMCRGKWSKEKCFEEAKKYKTKSEFCKNAPRAHKLSIEKGWINDMDWFPINETRPKGFWRNKENFLNEARKYRTKKELEKGCLAAYSAGHKYGYLDECTWFENRECLPFGYWKDKEHCIEESKKYTSRNEFRKGNQSAYWASLKYEYIDDMPWLSKRKSVKRGSLKNKEFILEESKKYKTRTEFMKENKSAYNAAQKYGWLKEMVWLPLQKPKKTN